MGGEARPIAGAVRSDVAAVADCLANLNIVDLCKRNNIDNSQPVSNEVV